MVFEFEKYGIDAIHEKYAWRICDFVVINAERLKHDFPKILEQNQTPDLAKYFVEKKCKQFQNREEFLYVLKEKERRTVIGLIYIKAIDWKAKKAELAYCIGYQHEGKGWMTQAVKAFSDHAFGNLAFESLRIIVHESNIGGIRVAEKCGYIWEKTVPKEHRPPNKEPLDMELYERCR